MSDFGNDKLTNVAYGGLGIFIFLVLWEFLGKSQILGTTWPAFTDVVSYLFDPKRNGLFQRASAATLSKAAGGFSLGSILGIVTAAAVHVFPLLRPGTDRLSSFLHSIPAIALAPIFLIFVPRDFVGMAIATMNAYFIIYIATTSGLNNSTKSHRDVFTVLGASRLNRLLLLDLPAALPPVVTGLKYAVSAAIVGAIIGEWFGASRGLGVLIVSAMQNYQINLLWAAVLIVTIVSLLFYGLGTLAERFIYRRFT